MASKWQNGKKPSLVSIQVVMSKLTVCINIPVASKIANNFRCCQVTVEVHDQHCICCHRHKKWLDFAHC